MFRTNRCCERPVNYNSTSSVSYSSGVIPQYNDNAYTNMSMPMMAGPVAPIYECPQERVCHKEIIHEVPHVCPINTRVVNHHIYKHTYTPCYTSCEENEISNVYDGCCNKF